MKVEYVLIPMFLLVLITGNRITAGLPMYDKPTLENQPRYERYQ